jgi:hypothetical protein
MKKIVMMLMIGLLSKGALHAQERSGAGANVSSLQELVSERVVAFMSALGIAPGSDRCLTNITQERLSKEKLKSLGGLEVRHGKERRLGTNVVSTSLEFFDAKKTRVGSARVILAPSERTAQVELLKTLVVNSLPLDVVVARYSLQKNGPGDLCLVEIYSDNGKKMDVAHESVLHLVRGNVAISVTSEDSSLRAEELASLLDGELLRESK